MPLKAALQQVAEMYLDNAATSFPKPECVYTAVNDWMRNGMAAGRGSYQGTDDTARMIDLGRSGLVQLLGLSSPSRVIYTLNCTDSLNTVLQGYLNDGDRVVASTIDHNSVLRPLQALKQRGITVELADFDPHSGQIDVEQFSRLVSSRPTRLAVITHASNVTGTLQPVRELIRAAHEAGAAVLLDAAQTAGHIPISMQDMGVAFLAVAGHKGLLGPLGTGVLCLGPDQEKTLQPLRYGGTGTRSEFLEQPFEMPTRYESGNANVPGIAGLCAGVSWILNESVERIHQRSQASTSRLIDGLREISGVELLSSVQNENVGIVTFNIMNQDCREVAMILDQSFQIQCRAGLHCAPLAHRTLGTFEKGGAVRLSPGVFTTDDEIQSAIQAVHAIAQLG
ncbi:MAG: aminotransferase class V-fold PLP-dependent enzyme [Planctomycetaceae bacterium]